jgi:fibrillarin-like pre-rRNA processing protein
MGLKKIGDNVFWFFGKGKLLVSKNLVSGDSVYGEKLIKIDKDEYREWIPARSKLSAAFYNGLKAAPIREGSKVLYLGASSGTTVSHVSDIVGKTGEVYAVEISEEMGAQLILLAESRKNIFPIIEDARKTEQYAKIVPKCDFLYQDVAQRDQVEIFIKNSNQFIKNGGYGALAIKTKSVDVSKPSRFVIDQTISALERNFSVIESINLYPYQRDHALIFVRKK